MFSFQIDRNRFYGKFLSEEEAKEFLRSDGWTFDKPVGYWFKRTSDGGRHFFGQIVPYPEIHEASDLSVLTRGESGGYQ